ncbi:MAG: TrfB-related DNA-binding protein [Methylococcaceae bacterium]|nr:TrfB-related DNA-binding protein [Methylococcaceae bacterium]
MRKTKVGFSDEYFQKCSTNPVPVDMKKIKVWRIGILTAAEFDSAVASFPRLSEKGKKAARLVLVDGFTQVAVADKYEVTKQQVGRWVNNIYGKHITDRDS